MLKIGGMPKHRRNGTPFILNDSIASRQDGSVDVKITFDGRCELLRRRPLVFPLFLCFGHGEHYPPGTIDIDRGNRHLRFEGRVWFRRGRLFMVAPDSQASACPLSGRNSTYRPVKKFRSRLSPIRTHWCRHAGEHYRPPMVGAANDDFRNFETRGLENMGSKDDENAPSAPAWSTCMRRQWCKFSGSGLSRYAIAVASDCGAAGSGT
jgi:hypothetical protein